MQEVSVPRWRTVLAVAAGWLTWGALAFLSAVVFRVAFPQEYATATLPAVLNVANLLAAVFYYSLSGFTTASLVRDRVKWHVLILTGIHLFIILNVQSQVWNTRPVWYHVALFAVTAGAPLLGGYIKQMLRNEIF
jgi:hypothetical protein